MSNKIIDTDDLTEILPFFEERFDDINGDFAVEAGDFAVFSTGSLQSKITVPEGKKLIVTQRVGLRMVNA